MFCIRRDHRQGHDLRGLHARLFCDRHFLGLPGDLGRIQFLRNLDRGRGLCFLRQALLDIPQHGQAGFGIVEHVPWLAAPGLYGLHVVLDADNCIGHAIRFFLRQPAGAFTREHQCDQSPDPVDDLHRSRLVQHHQAGFDATNQRRNAVEPLRRRLRGDALPDRFLDAREIDDALAHHRFGDLLVIRGFLRRKIVIFVVFLARDDQPDKLLIETILNA